MNFIKILITLLICVSVIGLIFLLLCTWRTNLSLPKLQLSSPISNIIGNTITMFIMVAAILVTIIYSNQQIQANRESTEKQIAKINDLEIIKKKSLLKALLYETELNISFFRDIKAQYNNLQNKNPDKLYGVFFVDALNANLSNNTIQDKDLLASITRLKNVYIIIGQMSTQANSQEDKHLSVDKLKVLDIINGTKDKALIQNFKQKYDLLPQNISMRTVRYFELMRIIGDNETTITNIIEDIKNYDKSLLEQK